MERDTAPKKPSTLKGGRRFLFYLLMVLVCFVVVIAAGELLVLLLKPQVSLYPRWEFSVKYGREHFKDVRMVHRQPRHWKFVYTINELGYRGRAVPVADRYVKRNIVVLGDSYAMGMGVNDGEDFAAVMDKNLADGWNVINMACGGWGLTQQIRRFYETGLLYKPSAVVLQFCKNDPGDNFIDKVTTIENGRFVFHNTNRQRKLFASLLSRSYLVQNSQLYSFARSFYNPFREVEEAAAQRATDAPGDDSTPVGVVHGRTTTVAKPEAGTAETSEPPPITRQEVFYNELIEPFAADLHRRGILFLMISVNGEIDLFPYIKRKVMELDRQGLLDYLEVTEWFEGIEDYDSPEGHLWGTKGHRIIGDQLTRVIHEHDTTGQ
ncbi:MAG: SGNH/GDSL hydrolase family protein [bacterium]|nr:MAG: SGNH/GDSL hydrolase family protein [bacterium]